MNRQAKPTITVAGAASEKAAGASGMGTLITLPNALTALRIFLVPVLVVVVLTRYERTGFAIFVAASATDWLDGHLARKRQQVTTLGKLLDPLADKLLICAAFISLVELGLAPAWMVVVVVGRELAVTGLRAVAADQGVTIPASPIGKYKMAAQVVAVGILILGSQMGRFIVLGEMALWVVVVLAIVSMGMYFARFWQRLGLGSS